MSFESDTLEIRLGEQSVVFPRRLLDRYNVPGPRYTSYPTAPEWSESFAAADFERALGESSPGAPLSLYQHLPFCDNLCLFCGCNVVINRNHEVARPYLDRLKREVDDLARRIDASRPVVQFHWGGGTPTYLSAAEIEDLFGATRERFRFAPDAEIGIEVDPRVTTPEHVAALRRLGFNRISMGVQDFDPLVQQTVHRVQPYELTKELFDLCRAEGFASINLDLIYGLPHQTVDRFRRTVDQVIGLGPDRIALFSYAHVPWLKKQQGAFARHIPEGLDKFRLFQSGIDSFTRAGYVFIGFDHFARPADELCRAQRNGTLGRNFQGFTTHAGTDLVGLGVSSISSIGRSYAQNHRDLPAYYRAIDAGRLATLRGARLGDDDLVRRDVITRLLCHLRLDKREVAARHAIDFDAYFADEAPRLRELEVDGLVALDDDAITVTALGRLFVRVVGMAFDAYLRKRDAASRPLFSKTV